MADKLKLALFIEYKAGEIKKADLGMISALRGEDRELYALIINASAHDAKAKLETYGVEHIVAVDISPMGSSWNPDVWSRAVIEAMRQLGIRQLAGLTTPLGRDLLPRVAAALDAPLIMDCMKIDPLRKLVSTSQYSGKTIASIQLNGEHAVYGIRANTVQPVQCPATADILPVTCPVKRNPGFEVIGTRAGSGDTQNLAEADVIISGGRGMKNAENFKLLFDCARQLDNAAVGASRVAVDNGWVPYSMQVGQTGVKVNPKVYIACGISGSIQHFAGMKSSGIIIAVNTDPGAAIMSKCDYFVVGDLFAIMRQLREHLADKG